MNCNLLFVGRYSDIDLSILADLDSDSVVEMYIFMDTD